MEKDLSRSLLRDRSTQQDNNYIDEKLQPRTLYLAEERELYAYLGTYNSTGKAGSEISSAVNGSSRTIKAAEVLANLLLKLSRNRFKEWFNIILGKEEENNYFRLKSSKMKTQTKIEVDRRRPTGAKKVSSKVGRESLAESIRNSSVKIDLRLDHIFTKGRVYKYSHPGIVLIVLAIFGAFFSIYIEGLTRYSYQTLVYSEILYKSDTLESSSKWI